MNRKRKVTIDETVRQKIVQQVAREIRSLSSTTRRQLIADSTKNMLLVEAIRNSLKAYVVE